MSACALGLSSHQPEGTCKVKKKELSAEVVKARGVSKRKHREQQDVVGKAGATLCVSHRGKQRKLNAKELQEQLLGLEH